MSRYDTASPLRARNAHKQAAPRTASSFCARRPFADRETPAARYSQTSPTAGQPRPQNRQCRLRTDMKCSQGGRMRGIERRKTVRGPMFSSNRSQPWGFSVQTNGQQRRSRIRQSVNDVKVMPAAFRRPRARPSFGQESSLPKKSRSFLRANPDVGLNCGTQGESGGALACDFRRIEAQVGVHRRERDRLQIGKRRDRHDPLDEG